MKKNLILIHLFLFYLVFPQELSMNLVKNMIPRNIGPSGMSGRVTAIDVVLSNTDIIYAGTASGGLWKSSSGGTNWKPIFDSEITSSIGCVSIQQSNPDVIWVGTGEGNPRNSLNGGYGIFKSIDGGNTWKSMGLENTRHIHRVIINPEDPKIVYVGAIGSPWGEHSDRGVYKTKDGGITWEKILYENNKTGIADLVMDPNNPNKLIAAMWEHKRDPWFFNSGGNGSGIHITYDGGENWQKLTSQDGLPEGDLGRIGLAISKNKSNIVYALIEAKKNALFKSFDGGSSWKKINDKTREIGNRPFYYADLYVDPQNENRLYTIFTYVNKSEDGGKNFDLLMPAYGVSNGVHPDHHAWWIHPENGDFIIDGNDGGLNITKDGGKTWRFIGNLPVGQFYHINIDNETPYNVYGGMQDNGSWRGPAYVWREQGIRNDYWQEISFGDGFDVIPDPNDNRYGWSMSQGGYVSRFDWKTGNNYIVKPMHPDPNTKLRFNWNSAINIDPFDSNTIYFGSQFVHKSVDKGDTWEIISNDLTTNDSDKLNQNNSGGLTMDVTGAENYCSILVIEPSTVEENVIWVGTDDGKVQFTNNGGDSWVDVSDNIKGLPKGSWITQIKASKKNKGEALLVANDYRRYNYEPYAYRTTNYGKSWKRIVDESDVFGYTLCIVEDQIESKLMFLGTDDGLYVSIDSGNYWSKWKNKFPTVPVTDLMIHPIEHDLVIGTFGRAAWILDDIEPLRFLAANNGKIENPIKLFKPKKTYKSSFQQPTGSRFPGDAIYSGHNREKGAKFSFFINNKNKVEKDSTYKWDSLSLKIYSNDKLIRNLKRKIPKSNGVYHWIWNMDEKGTRSLSRNIVKNNYGEPSGVEVLAGRYRAVINYGNISSEQFIEIDDDPRIIISKDNKKAIYDSLKYLEKLKSIAYKATTQLAESKITAEKYLEDLKTIDKEKYSDIIKISEKTIEKIDNLFKLFLGKQDNRQGITEDEYLSFVKLYYQAYQYVESRQNGITITEKKLIEQTRNKLEDNLKKFNHFFENEWVQYKILLESAKLSKFKETETIKLK